MTARTASIHLDSAGSGTITVDGHQLRGIRSLTLDAAAGEVPQLTLELRLLDVSTMAETSVLIDDDTAATLVALGWTPPPDQEVPDATAHQ